MRSFKVPRQRMNEATCTHSKRRLSATRAKRITLFPILKRNGPPCKKLTHSRFSLRFTTIHPDFSWSEKSG